MEKCSQCGSLNDNKLLNCKECNNKLDEPLSKLEEKEAIEQANSLDDNYYEDLYAPAYAPFEVTLFDKIIGGLSAAGIVTSILLISILPKSYSKGSFLISCLLLLGSFLYSFFPNALWRLSKIDLAMRFNNASSLEPSDFYMAMRKVVNVLFLAVGIYIIFTYKEDWVKVFFKH